MLTIRTKTVDKEETFDEFLVYLLQTIIFVLPHSTLIALTPFVSMSHTHGSSNLFGVSTEEKSKNP